ncbi:unnamed protein product [Symbiodinium pilosum]|uniref:HEAT repeat domain-containing protein n=1 Tax=Symbiodinium pilosum TaxID=2952 RepID=A0A812Y093_SYMPI|nr:unnamed protein product [Symbiodinium pilosum]
MHRGRMQAPPARQAIWPPPGPMILAERLKELQDKNVSVRRNAAIALGEMGPRAAEAVLRLIKALKDQDADVRTAAAEALGKIAPAAAKAVPQLIKALDDKDRSLRRNAAVALWRINPAALPWESLIPPLARVDALEPTHDILLMLVLSHGPNSEDSMDPRVATAVQEAVRYSLDEDVLRSAVKVLPASLRTSHPGTVKLRGLVQRALLKVPIAAVECKLHELLESGPAHHLHDAAEQDRSLPDSSEVSFKVTLSSSGNPVTDKALLAEMAGHLPPKTSSAGQSEAPEEAPAAATSAAGTAISDGVHVEVCRATRPRCSSEVEAGIGR